MSLFVDIKKSLGDFELKIRFETDNEVFALLGASGCGKSMTLKCIAGIEKPDSGVIRLNETTLFDSKKNINLPPQKRHIGYLFQNYALFPNMTVRENIEFVIQTTGTAKRDMLATQVQRFQLAGLEDLYPAQLSGGQQQRTAFARILASQPEVLMLDEPFSALDSYLKWQVEQELRVLLKTYQRPVLLVSHDRDEVFRLSQRVAVLAQGNIDVIHSKHDLFDSPETLAATLITGCKNISMAKKIDSHTLYAQEWGLQLRVERMVPDDLCYVGFRAHFFEIAQSSKNSFAVEIIDVVEDTFSMLVMIRPQGSAVKPLRWELGKELWQRVSPVNLFLTIPEDKIILMKK